MKTIGKRHPTQQWGSGEGHNITIDGIDQSTGKPYITTDKAGLYAGPTSAVLDIWHERLIRGTSFSAVNAALS